ncbi:hypothetical protein J2S09_001155 [Bacillus fengqiuensis]|nr:hypothetical protein [Bacillus fengqiuensis]
MIDQVRDRMKTNIERRVFHPINDILCGSYCPLIWDRFWKEDTYT